MGHIRLLIVSILLITCYTSKAQSDSVLNKLQQLPEKYFTKLDNKIDQYSNRITKRTEKTLSKLSRWETKIQTFYKK